MAIYKNVTELVGNTPLLKASRYAKTKRGRKRNYIRGNCRKRRFSFDNFN